VERYMWDHVEPLVDRPFNWTNGWAIVLASWKWAHAGWVEKGVHFALPWVVRPTEGGR